MKRVLLFISFLFFALVVVAANDSTSVEQQATNAYKAKNFVKSISILEAEASAQKAKGLESADLYYNLGNAYFRNNDVAHAMLNYERALLLNPNDQDIRHNIEYLRTKIENKPEVEGSFFLTSWFISLQNNFSSNTWAVISVVLFLLLIACLSVFFFTKSIFFKKIVFYKGLVLIGLLIFTNTFAINQKNKLMDRNAAIIMAGSVPILSSPDIDSKELATILHAGAKVIVNKEDQDWVEIKIGQSVGWVPRDKIEII